MKSVIFDNAAIGDLSLSGTATYEAADALNASTPAPTLIDETSGNIDIISGVDFDGVTTLEVRRYHSNGNVVFLRNGEVVLTKSNFLDSLAFGSPVDDGDDHRPYAGTIAHGLIVFFCRRTSGGTIKGPSVIMMQASSTSATDWFSAGNITLTSFANLAGDSSKDNTTYGREWAVPDKGFSVSGYERALGRAIIGVDYRINGGGGNVGGQLMIFGIWRASINDRWTLGSPVMKYDTVVEDGARAVDCHMHNGVFESVSPTRAKVGVIMGDGNDNNVIIGLDLTVESGELFKQFDTATIDGTYEIHGTQGTSGTGTHGKQFFYVIEASPGVFIGGADQSGDGMIRFTLPSLDDATPIISMETVAFGAFAAGSEVSHNVYSIARDEGNRMVAAWLPGVSAPGETDQASFRIAASNDSGATWAICAKWPASNTGGSVYIVGDNIHISQNGGGSGIYSIPFPSTVKRRGLICGQGATNIVKVEDANGWVLANFGSGNSGTFGTFSGGEVTVNGYTKEAPPTVADGRNAVLIEAGTANSLLGIHRPSNVGETPVPNGGYAWFTFWMAPVEESGLDWRFHVGNGSTWDNSNVHIVKQYSTTWQKKTIYGTLSPGGAWRPVFRCQADNGAALPQKAWIVLDSLTVDEPPSDYPTTSIPLDGAADVVIASNNNAITGFTCSDSWTIMLDLRMLSDSWDTSVHSFYGDVLFANIFGSATELITATAQHNSGSPRVRFNVFNSGSSAGTIDVSIPFFCRDDPAILVLSYTSGALAAYVQIGGSKPGGNVFEGDSSGSLALSTQPTEVRFYTDDDAARVVVRGVHVDESEALSSGSVQRGLVSGRLNAARATPRRLEYA